MIETMLYTRHNVTERKCVKNYEGRTNNGWRERSEHHHGRHVHMGNKRGIEDKI